MDKRTIRILFALLRSAIQGTHLTEREHNYYSPDMLPDLLKICTEYDVNHLLVLGLKQNELITEDDTEIEKNIFKAVYRYESLHYEYNNLCDTFEKAKIPFVSLKGSVICRYYPEAWMRTMCDIDILVHSEDLNTAIDILKNDQNYAEKERSTHDISLLSPTGIHVELHFDLVEEERANNANAILSNIWNNVTKEENSIFCYEMSDEYFYFYHIAHMAKHFENGGCGIRPFIDLFIMEHLEDADFTKRDELLNSGGLLRFAIACRKLISVWFNNETMDDLSEQMQDFILRGGIYGTTNNRVAVHKKYGNVSYILSRMFVSYARLRRYYPILKKHKWLTPIMQIRRWFMILNPSVRKMVKNELYVNRVISDIEIQNTQILFKRIGL